MTDNTWFLPVFLDCKVPISNSFSTIAPSFSQGDGELKVTELDLDLLRFSVATSVHAGKMSVFRIR